MKRTLAIVILAAVAGGLAGAAIGIELNGGSDTSTTQPVVTIRGAGRHRALGRRAAAPSRACRASVARRRVEEIDPDLAAVIGGLPSDGEGTFRPSTVGVR